MGRKANGLPMSAIASAIYGSQSVRGWLIRRIGCCSPIRLPQTKASPRARNDRMVQRDRPLRRAVAAQSDHGGHMPEATSTSDQLSMFPPETSPDIRSAISSPASEAGPSPSASPDGPMTARLDRLMSLSAAFGRGTAARPCRRTTPLARFSPPHRRVPACNVFGEQVASGWT